MSVHHRMFFCILAAMLLPASPVLAASQTFGTELDPAPFEPSTIATVAGDGNVSATLDGHSLSVSGNFSGLPSPATAAHVEIGSAMGVLGNAIGELTVTHATSGSISGKIDLNAKQLAALRAKSLYIRIDSEKAPDGNLQGWLEAAGNN